MEEPLSFHHSSTTVLYVVLIYINCTARYDAPCERYGYLISAMKEKHHMWDTHVIEIIIEIDNEPSACK